MQLMLDCKRFVERKLTPEERKSLNYTQLGWEALGPFGKWAVNISVLTCNLGVCAGYMIFISSNLEVCKSVIVHTPNHTTVTHTHDNCSLFSLSHTQWSFTCLLYQNGNRTCLTTWELYAIILPILILLTFLPSFKILAYSAYVGSIFLVVAMVVSAGVCRCMYIEQHMMLL